jgi:hypothetical protein
MRLPFTADQFFGVFRLYNEAVWPMQVILTALALLCVVLVAWPRSWSNTFVSAVLAFLWAWLAFAYHLLFFARINPVAYGFAAVSAVGAGVFLWCGVHRGAMRCAMRKRDGRTALGVMLVGYALAVYPLLSIFTGHRYPGMPTFGLPCPTTIFTIGMLTLIKSPQPRMVMIVPVLWCVVGVQAAFLLGVPQDLALGAAAPVGLWAMRSRANSSD